MEEREFRSPSRNLGSPMTRSVTGALSNAMSGVMSQTDEVYRLRKQVSVSFKLNLDYSYEQKKQIV